MSRRSVQTAVLAAVSLIASTARAQGFAAQRQEKMPGPPEAAPAGPPKPVRYVMTISGGISLGAYEAGFNWALLGTSRNTGRTACSRVRTWRRWSWWRRPAPRPATSTRFSPRSGGARRRPSTRRRAPATTCSGTPGSRSASTSCSPVRAGCTRPTTACWRAARSRTSRRSWRGRPRPRAVSHRAASCRSASPSRATGWAAWC